MGFEDHGAVGVSGDVLKLYTNSSQLIGSMIRTIDEMLSANGQLKLPDRQRNVLFSVKIAIRGLGGEIIAINPNESLRNQQDIAKHIIGQLQTAQKYLAALQFVESQDKAQAQHAKAVRSLLDCVNFMSAIIRKDAL